MKKLVLVSAGVALLAVSICGLWHGLRTAAAQAKYHEAKYGDARDDLAAILGLCETAHRLYPHNYHFSLWAADQTFAWCATSRVASVDARLADVRRWTRAGLASNPYKIRLRWLYVNLLAAESPAAAVAYWDGHVAWQFWNPYNHAVLVELCVAAGDYAKALQALRWVEGSTYYLPARKALLNAWRQEKRRAPPRG